MRRFASSCLSLLLLPTLAVAAPLVVRGDDADRSLACASGQDVQVNGSDHRVTLTGDCGAVVVRGSDNRLVVDGVASVRIEGSDNDLGWKRNLSGQARLPAALLGSDNRVHALDAGPSGDHPAGDPPAGDPPASDHGGSPKREALVVSGTGKHQTLTCAPGQDVTVRGSGHDLKVDGDCGALRVDGSTITVVIDGVAAIHVEGSMNKVVWARDLSADHHLPITRDGSMIDVRGP